MRREGKTHELKTDSPYFQAVLDGRKRFTIRKSDRDFQVGDKLIVKKSIREVKDSKNIGSSLNENKNPLCNAEG
ncbi:DUF3850 domain-containing protein [Aneurinibacillus sp. UBA3580]|uniref:DUF3850 domain-containing protein n=1 Tax=Aneurinibacillus sp. UBA3580 TaxID=1946041 RepID=UPI00257D6B8F|nr:DUF3850 domain-containing protein [Aneurinibacillus sp. UBA3580]